MQSKNVNTPRVLSYKGMSILLYHLEPKTNAFSENHSFGVATTSSFFGAFQSELCKQLVSSTN